MLARERQWLEGPRHAPYRIRARCYAPHTLSHVSVPALWYWQFRGSNRQSTSSTWPHWEQSCQAPRGSALEKPQPYSGLLTVLQYPGSFLKATVILKERCRTFRATTTRREGNNDKGSGTAPDGAPAGGENDKEGKDDEGFKTVDDEDEDMGGKVIVKIPLKDLDKPEGSRHYGS